MDIKNKMVIQTITAFVSVDADGNEGIIGQQMPQPTPPFTAWMPFIFADPANARRIMPIAIDIYQRTKVPFKVIQFETRVDMTQKYTNEYNEEIRNAKLN